MSQNYLIKQVICEVTKFCREHLLPSEATLSPRRVTANNKILQRAYNNYKICQRAIAIFILITFLTLVPSIQAISPSPSPTALPTVSDDEVKKSLMERLKKASEEKSEEAGKILGAKTKIAVIGKLEDIANKTLTIRAQNNSEVMAAVDDTTIFVRNGKTVKLSDIQIGDFTIAMGYKNGKEILEAKRIVASDQEPEKNTNLVLWGTIEKIDANKKTFEFTDNAPVELGGPHTYLITVSKKTNVDFEKLTDKSIAVIIGTLTPNSQKSVALKAFRLISSPSEAPTASPTPKTSPTPKS